MEATQQQWHPIFWSSQESDNYFLNYGFLFSISFTKQQEVALLLRCGAGSAKTPCRRYAELGSSASSSVLHSFFPPVFLLHIYIYMLSLALFLCFSIFMPTFSARMIYCSELHAVGSSTILIYYFHACQYCQRPLFVLCGRNNVSAQQSTQFSALLRTLNAHSVFALHFDNSAKRRFILPIGWTAVAETVDPRRHSLRKIHFQPACMDDAMQKGYG